MRTTVTLPNDLVEQAMDASGKRKLSDAIATTLHEHFALKRRLALLDELFDKPVPHDFRRIKRRRRKRKWSSS